MRRRGQERRGERDRRCGVEVGGMGVVVGAGGGGGDGGGWGGGREEVKQN